MQNVVRSVMWIVILVLALIVVSVFLNFLIKIAVLTALVAFAYYWFTRAVRSRRNKPW